MKPPPRTTNGTPLMLYWRTPSESTGPAPTSEELTLRMPKVPLVAVETVLPWVTEVVSV